MYVHRHMCSSMVVRVVIVSEVAQIVPVIAVCVWTIGKSYPVIGVTYICCDFACNPSTNVSYTTCDFVYICTVQHQ